MVSPFTEEEVAYLRKAIQNMKDREAWGRLSTNIKTVGVYLLFISGFVTVFKEPLLRLIGMSE